MQSMYSFFNEPYDYQLVLGITLVGIPENWGGEQILRYIRAYSILFGDEPPIGFCGITLQDATEDEPKKAHLICDNILTKQKCLQMRVLPVVVPIEEGEEEDVEDDELPYQCAVVSIRPYCFWVRRSSESPVIPFMLPKYTSREVLGEEFEAKMLLMPNNQRMLVVATMIGSGLLPTDHTQLDVTSVLQLWLAEITGNKGQYLTDQLSHLQNVVSNFTPHPLCVSDELIFAADYKLLYTWSWPWDPRMMMHNEFQRSCELVTDGRSNGAKNGNNPKIRRGSRHTGCIRYESNRKRWVVDLSVNGCRMQKCFHENLYGIVGGLQEARRWRMDYIRNTHNEFDVEAEERIVNDLVDKIVALDRSHQVPLLAALKKPIEGYEYVMSARSLGDIVNGRLAALGLQPQHPTLQPLQLNG
ncbi:hypothetical protein BaOVIS_029170 [Babesia ovis]|uniref:Uncharacterized protein n=1 Tax=Babesia ovis TaxID=5869 RepID=A0A9W5WW13_BABOV|nr:hypothetical protein BaOVIS_029170 [Babesia ovis]